MTLFKILYTVIMKKIIWLGSSYRRILEFPEEAREIAGRELHEVQYGRMPSDWKSIVGIGTGVIEIRIHNPNEHRVLYVARFKKAIYVLHAFQKQTQQITLKDLKVARKAYAQIKNDAKEKSERRNVSRRL